MKEKPRNTIPKSFSFLVILLPLMTIFLILSFSVSAKQDVEKTIRFMNKINFLKGIRCLGISLSCHIVPQCLKGHFLC